MAVTNSMDAGDARGFTAPSFACDRQPAYSATGFTSSARKAVCQDTYLHPLSQQVTAKISPLSTAKFPRKHAAALSSAEAFASPSVTSCSAENSIRTDILTGCSALISYESHPYVRMPRASDVRLAKVIRKPEEGAIPPQASYNRIYPNSCRYKNRLT